MMIFNKRVISKNYNVLFICVEEFINDNKIKISKFYFNKDEYIEFVNSLQEHSFAHSFHYQYYYQTITREDIFELFYRLDVPINQDFESSVDSINNILKDITISFGHDEYYRDIEIQRYRDIANQYFSNRVIELKKTTKTFHFKESVNDRPITTNQVANFVMYNVGQGNLSALFIDGFPSFIFDLGYGRKCSHAEWLLNHLQFNGSKLTTIIISHYDNDHINYARSLPDYGANLEFIMPEFLNNTDVYKPNIQILLNKAIHNGNRVCFILNNKLVSPINYGPLTFYQGNMAKIDPNQSTNENSHGIVTVINSLDDKVLIPGDSLYLDMFTNIIGNLKPTYVIIPHHGCNIHNAIGYLNYLDLSNLKESFVFAGPHGFYKHPNKTHLDFYTAKPIVRFARKACPKYIYNHGRKIPDSICDVKNSPFYYWSIK